VTVTVSTNIPVKGALDMRVVRKTYHLEEFLVVLHVMSLELVLIGKYCRCKVGAVIAASDGTRLDGLDVSIGDEYVWNEDGAEIVGNRLCGLGSDDIANDGVTTDGCV
jgi:hypothetical protein